MRANIYIRKENEEEWEKLKDKSEWVNWHLTEKRTKGETSEEALPMHAVDEDDEGPGLKPPSVSRAAQRFCEHGAAVGFCKFKSCRAKVR